MPGEGLLVAGTGVAGLEAALTARRLEPKQAVTMVGPEELLFLPHLVQVPAGRRRVEEVSFPLAALARRSGVELRAQRAVGLDPDRLCLALEAGEALGEEVVLALGAAADRQRVPGAASGAVSCGDLDGVLELSRRLRQGHLRRLAFLFGWERPGPGLEMAAWIARERGKGGLPPALEVLAVDGDGLLGSRYGEKGVRLLEGWFRSWGGRLISGAPVRSVERGGLTTSEGREEADLVAVLGPLVGPDLALPGELREEGGFIAADEAMGTCRAGVFAAGDCVRPPGGAHPNLIWARTSGALAAAAALAHRRGQEPPRPRSGRKEPLVIPDVGGRGLLVRSGRTLLSGAFPLVLREAAQNAYLRRLR